MRFWSCVRKLVPFQINDIFRFCQACLSLCCYLVFFFSLPDVAVADVIETVDTIYQQAENNGIAEAICKAIDIGKIFMVPLFAIMFCIYGFRAFQGDGAKWSTFITFAIGMAAFNSAGTFLEWFMPKMGLNYGCKCAIERDIRDTNGVIKTYPTGLNYDCSMGTTDYYSLHGLSNGDIGQQAMLKREEITRLKEIVSSYENLFSEVEGLTTQMEQKQLEVQQYNITYQNANAIYSAYNGSDILIRYENLKSIVTTTKVAMDTEQQSYDAISLEIKNVDAQINELKNKIAKQESVVGIAKTNYNEAVVTLNKYKEQNNQNSNSVAVFTSIVDNSKNILQNEENNLKNYQNRLDELNVKRKGKKAVLDEKGNIVEQEIIGLETSLDNAKSKLDKAKEAYKQAVKNLEEYETKVEMKMYLESKNNTKSSLDDYNKSQIEYNNLLTKWQVKKQKLDSMTSAYGEAKSKIATLQIELAQLTSS